MDKTIQQALETWYPEDHPLHLDPLHPAIGLAGEAGKLLNLYKKERFKDGFSWWDCVHCGTQHKDRSLISTNVGLFSASNFHIVCNGYTPKVLDELGNFWYYLRILAWQCNSSLTAPTLPLSRSEMDVILSMLNGYCSKFLNATVMNMEKGYEIPTLGDIMDWFAMCLREVDCTLDQLKDGDNNGWQETLENVSQ